jgi:hypothetical protein
VRVSLDTLLLSSVYDDAILFKDCSQLLEQYYYSS